MKACQMGAQEPLAVRDELGAAGLPTGITLYDSAEAVPWNWTAAHIVRAALVATEVLPARDEQLATPWSRPAPRRQVRVFKTIYGWGLRVREARGSSRPTGRASPASWPAIQVWK